MSGFANDYALARQRFLAAADEAGALLRAHRHPTARDEQGCAVYADVAWLGPNDASNVLLCVSGTHGVEGHCGSACQTEILHGTKVLPPDTALLFVHALNPFGMAHDRRVNEDNIDVNRNWVEHAAPPHNEDYELVHAALVPDQDDESALATADAHLLGLAAQRGAAFVQAAISGGQWRHPDGLFYGGAALCWSTRTLAGICAEYLAGRHQVGYLDLHTGLGAWGAVEAIFRGGRDSRALERAGSWYGALTRSENGTASSTPILGNSAGVLADSLAGGPLLTAITVEFGTRPTLEVLAALRADNWRWQQEAVEPALAGRIREQMREAFWPSDPLWRSRAVDNAIVFHEKALAGLVRDSLDALAPELSVVEQVGGNR